MALVDQWNWELSLPRGDFTSQGPPMSRRYNVGDVVQATGSDYRGKIKAIKRDGELMVDHITRTPLGELPVLYYNRDTPDYVETWSPISVRLLIARATENEYGEIAP